MSTDRANLVPDVSVIIPAFNAGDHLDAAIISALDQSGPRVEVIVVDDGSTDGTPEVIERYGDAVRAVWQENAGPAAARNQGVSAARADLVAFLDADDTWLPDALAVLYDRFVSGPYADAVIGKVRIQTLEPGSVGPVFRDRSDAAFAFNLGAGLFRRRLFDEIGGFSSDLEPSEDVDWHMRLVESGRVVAKTDAVILNYRIHGSNLTLGQDSQWGSFLRAIGESIDRRQRKPGRPAQTGGV